MIVRCPECSTGFKLPKEKITTKGVKLRCSKCSHVFRIRSTDDGDTEIFYTDADGGPPESSSDEDDVVSDAEGSKTQFGMPNVNKGDQESGPVAGPGGAAAAAETDQEQDEVDAPGEDGGDEEEVDEAAASRSAQPDYNPFPHAGDSIKPKKESRFQSSSAKLEEDESGNEEPTDEHEDEERVDEPKEEGIDLFDDDEEEELEIEDDPFEGAFDDEAISGDSEKTTQAAGPAATKDRNKQAQQQSPASGGGAPSKAPSPQATDQPAVTGQAAPAESPKQSPEMDEVPTDDDSAFWSQQQESGFGSAEDMVDPSFGEDGAYFDAQQGKVDDGPKGAKESGDSPKGGPGQSSRAPAKSPQQGGASARGREQTRDKGEGGQAQSPSTGSANKKTSWDVEQPIEPHTVGGSGMQKAANFLLITLIVVGLFFAVLAVMADGFIDFKRLPHTLEVAFQGEDFEPREGWIPERPKVEKAPIEDPIRFQGVVGNVLDSDEGQMLAIRGRVKNVDTTPYQGVRVRAMLQDANGRVVTEQEAYVGKRLNLDDVLALESTDELQQLMPKQSPDVESNASQPFTIVFPEIPKRLQKSADLSYKVEMAAGDPMGGTEDSGAE